MAGGSTIGRRLTGKTHDVRVGRTLRFESGTIAVFDKGYVDYPWWKQITEDGAYFVTRLKEDLKYEVIRERERRRKTATCGETWTSWSSLTGRISN